MATRQKVSISIDSDLLSFIDTHSSNRSEVVNEALENWRKAKLEAEVNNVYAQASLKDIDPDLNDENWLLNDQALQDENID